MFGRRPDATIVRDAGPLRSFMPFISPRRNDSLVYFAHDIRVDAALDYCESWTRAHPDAPRLTLFHLILRGIVRTLDERPRLNRFTAGGRLWQRDGIWITFSAKQAFDDSAPVITVKRRFDPAASIETMLGDVVGKLDRGRQGERSTADSEVDWLLKLPPSITRLLMRIVEGIDALGLLPAKMIEPDPMFSSVFVANLGSVGLDAGYHHLWEHGNCPLFCVVGRIRPGPDGSRSVTLKWTYDERVEDGLYCARSLERLREFLENPEKS